MGLALRLAMAEVLADRYRRVPQSGEGVLGSVRDSNFQPCTSGHLGACQKSVVSNFEVTGTPVANRVPFASSRIQFLFGVEHIAEHSGFHALLGQDESEA